MGFVANEITPTGLVGVAYVSFSTVVGDSGKRSFPRDFSWPLLDFHFSYTTIRCQ